jgi:hypothetical protein
MAQKTRPPERQLADATARPTRMRISRRDRKELKKLERQLTGRRRFRRRRSSSARDVYALDLEVVISREVRKAVDAERASIRREAEEEIERRMDEFTEMMLRRQEKLMERAWQAFNRRARQPRQRARRKT